MSRDRIRIWIGGEAGQGLETMGQLLARGLVRHGYEILATQNYMSRIRGGHNLFSLIADTEAVHSSEPGADLLVALDRETIHRHSREMREGGLILADPEHVEQEKNTLEIPFRELITDKFFSNVCSLGVIWALLQLDRQIMEDLLREVLGGKEEDLAEKNATAFARGYDWARDNHPGFETISPAPSRGEKLALSGNQAVSLGALAAGADFCSFYPMTPATGVALNLAGWGEKFGIVVEQAEDEIAAINMAIGASFAGAKSIVPTSGGGFCLMAEGLSLAGMTETPVVVVLGQRPGPATGLPTRTEQADLQLALYSGHGEFPKAVFAPGSLEECFHLTAKALDVAQRSQSVAIVMTDQYLADSIRAVEPFNTSSLPEMAGPETETPHPESYERYHFAPWGLSQRLLPGTGKHLVVADSDEHTPDGHITEDMQIREKMVQKRLSKRQVLEEQVVAPDIAGPAQPELLLVCWGSSKGAVQQAAKQLEEHGISVGYMHFSQVWPMIPESFLSRLQEADRVVCAESNATGQLAQLIRQQTGFSVHQHVLRYDGLPLDAETIVRQIQ